MGLQLDGCGAGEFDIGHRKTEPEFASHKPGHDERGFGEKGTVGGHKVVGRRPVLYKEKFA